VLAGERPAWAVELAEDLAVDVRPEIREQYAAAARVAAAAAR
jgi:hypothetical protein